MRIQFEFGERFYRIFERGVKALESIDETLKAPPEDFTKEAESVRATTADVMSAEHAVHDAQGRIPHGTEAV